MLELANRFPDDLSGGQQQRLAILRTIAQKPAVICFDEPTSALDPLLKTHIARTITELSQAGYTILVATHDVQLVEQLPCTIFLMHAGSIVQTADSQMFMASPNNFPEIKNSSIIHSLHISYINIYITGYKLILLKNFVHSKKIKYVELVLDYSVFRAQENI